MLRTKDWQFVFNYSKNYARMEPFVRNLTIGFIKFHTFPEEGQEVRKKENFKGFMWHILFRVPCEFKKF